MIRVVIQLANMAPKAKPSSLVANWRASGWSLDQARQELRSRGYRKGRISQLLASWRKEEGPAPSTRKVKEPVQRKGKQCEKKDKQLVADSGSHGTATVNRGGVAVASSSSKPSGDAAETKRKIDDMSSADGDSSSDSDSSSD